MKKTLLALSVLVASTAANAGIELYNQDGVSVDLGGDLEVVYLKDTTKDSNPGQDLQDADFSFDVRYAATEDISVGAFWEFSGDGGTADTGDAYFGIYSGMHTAKVGKTATILDDAGIGSDYQFGVSSAFDDLDFGGSETIKYQLDTGMVYAGIAYQGNQGDNAYSEESVLDTDSESDTYGDIITSVTNSGTELVDMNIGVRVADFDFTAFYGHYGSAENDVWALEARFGGIEALNLELGYYELEKTANTIAFAADYTVEAWKFAAGVSGTDFDAAGESDVTTYFVNAGYAVAPSTTIYAEIGGTDESNTDTGYAVGIKSEF
ncbi:porin [Vibrio algarum]|uniref:Porin n=1 Tax=Vibrio algarum TaxID=3020714 RepID=A0ABT4YS06_9VIBR|nr:porin [Vibrio sp. KJ40-1]MDB1124340.1 porin [Vibrio sp. KJ40-1]